MNPHTDCERVRLQLMAAFDGEPVPTAVNPGSDPRQHLACCSPCGRWLQGLESMNSRFQGVSYPGPRVDLWATVETRLRPSDARQPLLHRLWLIGALVLGWRALQLLIDLPLPMLHPIVPLAAAIAALWQLACDPLAIETFAPELQKEASDAIP